MGQVVGELSGVCLEIVGVEPRDCLAACRCSRSRLIAETPDSSVWRISSWLNISSPAVFAGRDEPGSLRFVEGIDQRVRAAPATSPTSSEANTLPDTAAATSTSRVDAAQMAQPLPQHQPDALGHRHLVQLQVSTHPALLVEQHAGLDEVQIDLLYEKRVALSLAVDHPHQLIRRRLPGQRLQHRTYAIEGQPAQVHAFHQAAAPQLADDAGQRMMEIHFDRPGRCRAPAPASRAAAAPGTR